MKPVENTDMTPEEIESQLVVGAKVRLGKEYAAEYGYDEGQVIELIEGHFEYENGLYTEDRTAPAIWDEDTKDFDSIYHLFGNNMECFMDCEILPQ